MMQRTDRQAGVSLVEALVAMAVMAFGMLALLGLQVALRANSDASKQRAEAVRFAQEYLETKRRFSVLQDTSGLRHAFADIGTETPTTASLSGYRTSADFQLGSTVTVLPAGNTSDEDLYYTAARKMVNVLVTWRDRNDEAQRVELNAIISKTAPEVVGAMSVTGTGSVAQLSGGRNPAIPPGARNLTDEQGRENGKSAFQPPEASGVFWKFDNVTGFIVETCTAVTTAATVTANGNTVTTVTATGCTAFNRLLLSGYVRYAVGTGAPGSAESESPPDTGVPGIRMSVAVHVNGYTDTEESRPELCYADNSTTAFGAYFCAVPLSSTNSWSGRATVTFNKCWSRTLRHYNTDTTSPTYASDLVNPYRCAPEDAEFFASDSTLTTSNTLAGTADRTASRFRICRYTARRDQSLVSYPDTPPPPPRPWITNVEHPLDYIGVAQSLNNQNFLVIRAGDGTVAFECPDDNANTLLNGRTWYHQPS